jgi:uncharacterized membrane protein YedE/YeeE
MIGLVLVLIFAAGYATQRGSVCAVAAIEEWVLERRGDRFVAFLLCASCALFVMSVAALIGQNTISFHRGSSLPLLSAAGGVILGAGVWLNGRCAFGTVAKLGSGDLPRLGTLLGFLAGVVLSLQARPEPPPVTSVSPLARVPPLLIVLAAGAISAALAFWLRRAASIRTQAGTWSPLKTMLLIGGVNGVLMVLAMSWPYTHLLMDLAASRNVDLMLRIAMSLVFVLGAFAAAVAARRFRPNLGTRDAWLRALAGGVLMGFGATLVPGGNDAMLLKGLPLLLPSYVIAYAAMVATLFLIIAMARARLNHPSTLAH